MISPAINEIILKLFDCAAQGIPYLLANLSQLMSCSNIKLMDESAGLEAANDYILVAEDWQPNPTTMHLLEACPNNPRALMLSINYPTSFDCTANEFLVFEFETPASAEHALKSAFLQELMPHIQQAFMIAQQISEQIGDNQALHYVMQHHPLRRLFHTPVSQTALTAPIKFTREAPTPAANDIFDLTVSKESLSTHFKLSPSELALAKALFKGFSLNEITEARKVSKQTVRKQLQSILRKTGTDSQEALIVLLFDKCLLSQLENHSPAHHLPAVSIDNPGPAPSLGNLL